VKDSPDVPSANDEMDDDAVDRVIDSIADGDSIDWSALESSALTTEERQSLDCLRLVDGIAEAHRAGDNRAVSVPGDAPPLPSIEFRGTERFVLERCLGSGAFGTVYQAYDSQRRGHVALKVLNRVDAGALYRLKQEFRALADLSHPNLVSLYELLCDGGRWFISMELINGLEFVQFVEDAPRETEDVPGPGAASRVSQARRRGGRRRLTPAGVIKLEESLRQLGDGLAYLHSTGRLHHDIKPANVLVTPQGRVVLLDFGLVTEFGTGREDTIDFGTPAYMSPEHGTAAGFTAATDWYSVGVILFKVLTGTLPFEGSLTEVIAAKRERDAPEPRERVGDVPAHLNELCRRLLSRLPAVRFTAVDSLLRLRGSDQPARSVRASSPATPASSSLVGRTTHLRALMDAFESAKAGREVTVYVHGGSGLGKTALVQRFLEMVREREPDAVVLSGRCFERESVPYKALDGIVDALTRYLKRLPHATIEALLPRDVLALTRVFPILRRIDAVGEARQRALDIPDSQELRRRAFGAFRELFARLSSRHAVVLCIDDLQWGDADSSTLLTELLRPPDAPMLLLVAAYRTEEAESTVALQMLLRNYAAAKGDGSAREVVVRELSPSEAGVLADRLLADADGTSQQAGAIVREAGGNPYLLAELVRFVKTTNRDVTLPSSPQTDAALPHMREITLDEMIMTRVRQLPHPARRLLEILAVFGRPLDPSAACRTAGIEQQELEVCALLRAERLSRTRVTADREEIETYHDRIRETVVAHLSPDRLKAHHGALALALESVGADPEVLATHFQGAGDHAQASRCAIIAADRAADALAFDRAARLYRLALDLMLPDYVDRHAIEVRLGDALSSAGRGRDAAQVYLSAALGTKAAEELELWRRAAEQLLRSGHLDEGHETIRAVLSKMGMKLAASPRRALLSMFMRRAAVRLRGLRFRERDASQISAETLMRIDACWSVAMGLGIVDHVRGADFQARHMLLALSAGEPYRVARAIAMEIAYASVPGGPRARRRVGKLTEIAQALADRVDHPQLLGLLNLVRGTAANMLGDWKQSSQLCEAAETILRERCTGVGWELAASHLYALLSHSYLGDISQLSRRLPSLIQEARDRNDLNAVVNLRTRLSYLPFLAADDIDGARSEVRGGMAGWSQRRFTAQHYFELHAITEIALYAGDGIAAWSAVAQSWPALERSLLLRVQRVHIEALSLRARAATAAAAHQSLQQAQLLRVADRAIDQLRHTNLPYAMALADVVEAGGQVTRDRKPEALALLDAAVRGFAAADMPLHAAAAQRRLGQLNGSASDQTSADAWMTAHDVSNPRGMADLLAPGAYLP
jgi:serine/threonine protein kinase